MPQIDELRAIGPLTLKPEIVVANLEEATAIPSELDGAVGVFASIEAETAEMDPDEARALLEEFGVKKPGLGEVIAACYRALDLITFLTTGESTTYGDGTGERNARVAHEKQSACCAPQAAPVAAASSCCT